jgi:hypothetical protein
MTQANVPGSEPTQPDPTQPHIPAPDVAVARQLSRGRAWGLALWALIIFLCGSAAGWGVSMIMRPPPRMGLGFGPEPPVDEMVRRLKDELLLSDDQAKQVRQVYEDREKALRQIRDQMQPQMKAEYDKLDTQMKAILNSAQYQRWSERFRTLRERFLPPPHGEHGPWSGQMPGPPGQYMPPPHGMPGGPGPEGFRPPPGADTGGPAPAESATRPNGLDNLPPDGPPPQ